MLLINILLSGILAIAEPPVWLACMTILFAQLGLPAQALALAMPLCSLLDFPVTGVNIWCVQAEIALSAHSMGMIDEDVLRETKQRSAVRRSA